MTIFCAIESVGYNRKFCKNPLKIKIKIKIKNKNAGVRTRARLRVCAILSIAGSFRAVRGASFY